MKRNHTKICATCGRVIEWRKKWANDWDSVRYCSKSCRSSKPNATDRAFEQAIVDAIEHESVVDIVEATKSIDDDPRGNRRERIRQAARRLAATGSFEIIQNERPVDPSTARGEFQIRRA